MLGDDLRIDIDFGFDIRGMDIRGMLDSDTGDSCDDGGDELSVSLFIELTRLRFTDIEEGVECVRESHIELAFSVEDELIEVIVEREFEFLRDDVGERVASGEFVFVVDVRESVCEFRQLDGIFVRDNFQFESFFD